MHRIRNQGPQNCRNFTDYLLIQTILRHPLVADASKVVDMGSGPGRFGLFVGATLPEVSFVGYEYFAHRMKDSIAAAKFFGFSSDIPENLQLLDSNSQFSIYQSRH